MTPNHRPLPLCLLVSGVAGAASLCDSGLFLTSGTATYQIKTPTGTSKFTSRSVIQGDQIRVTTTDASGKATPTTWLCSSRGATLKTEPGGMAMSIQSSFLPGGTQLRPGYSWKSSTKLGRQGAGMTSNSTNRVTGREQVVTPAGRFTAWKIQIQTVSSLDMPAGTKTPPGMSGLNQTSESSAWYAPGVGLVRSEDRSNGVTLTLIKVAR